VKEEALAAANARPEPSLPLLQPTTSEHSAPDAGNSGPSGHDLEPEVVGAMFGAEDSTTRRGHGRSPAA